MVFELHSCDISTHLCGRPCDLHDKEGCLGQCSKVFPSLSFSRYPTYTKIQAVDHIDEEHMCPASHECGEVSLTLRFCNSLFDLTSPQPCGLINIRLPGGTEFSCPEHCRRPMYVARDFFYLLWVVLIYIEATNIMIGIFAKPVLALFVANSVKDSALVQTIYMR